MRLLELVLIFVLLNLTFGDPLPVITSWDRRCGYLDTTTSCKILISGQNFGSSSSGLSIGFVDSISGTSHTCNTPSLYSSSLVSCELDFPSKCQNPYRFFVTTTAGVSGFSDSFTAFEGDYPGFFLLEQLRILNVTADGHRFFSLKLKSVGWTDRCVSAVQIGPYAFEPSFSNEYIVDAGPDFNHLFPVFTKSVAGDGSKLWVDLDNEMPVTYYTPFADTGGSEIHIKATAFRSDGLSCVFTYTTVAPTSFSFGNLVVSEATVTFDGTILCQSPQVSFMGVKATNGKRVLNLLLTNDFVTMSSDTQLALLSARANSSMVIELWDFKSILSGLPKNSYVSTSMEGNTCKKLILSTNKMSVALLGFNQWVIRFLSLNTLVNDLTSTLPYDIPLGASCGSTSLSPNFLQVASKIQALGQAEDISVLLCELLDTSTMIKCYPPGLTDAATLIYLNYQGLFGVPPIVALLFGAVLCLFFWNKRNAKRQHLYSVFRVGLEDPGRFFFVSSGKSLSFLPLLRPLSIFRLQWHKPIILWFFILNSFYFTACVQNISNPWVTASVLTGIFVFYECLVAFLANDYRLPQSLAHLTNPVKRILHGIFIFYFMAIGLSVTTIITLIFHGIYNDPVNASLQVFGILGGVASSYTILFDLVHFRATSLSTFIMSNLPSLSPDIIFDVKTHWTSSVAKQSFEWLTKAQEFLAKLHVCITQGLSKLFPGTNSAESGEPPLKFSMCRRVIETPKDPMVYYLDLDVTFGTGNSVVCGWSDQRNFYGIFLEKSITPSTPPKEVHNPTNQGPANPPEIPKVLKPIFSDFFEYSKIQTAKVTEDHFQLRMTIIFNTDGYVQHFFKIIPPQTPDNPGTSISKVLELRVPSKVTTLPEMYALPDDLSQIFAEEGKNFNNDCKNESKKDEEVPLCMEVELEDGGQHNNTWFPCFLLSHQDQVKLAIPEPPKEEKENEKDTNPWELPRKSVIYDGNSVITWGEFFHILVNSGQSLRGNISKFFTFGLFLFLFCEIFWGTAQDSDNISATFGLKSRITWDLSGALGYAAIFWNMATFLINKYKERSDPELEGKMRAAMLSVLKGKYSGYWQTGMSDHVRAGAKLKHDDYWLIKTEGKPAQELPAQPSPQPTDPKVGTIVVEMVEKKKPVSAPPLSVEQHKKRPKNLGAQAIPVTTATEPSPSVPPALPQPPKSKVTTSPVEMIEGLLSPSPPPLSPSPEQSNEKEAQRTNDLLDNQTSKHETLPLPGAVQN